MLVFFSRSFLKACVFSASLFSLGGITASTQAAAPASGEEPMASSQAESQAVRVNINTADAKTLADKLIGVGQAKAELIVAWRKANGHFTKPEELLEIKGIGPSIFGKNKSRITL